MSILNALPSSKLRDYARLMRLDKPVGTLLLAWPTLWSLWLAGLPSHVSSGVFYPAIRPDVVITFLAGVFLMRSAGCVINDFADRKIDKHVERTKLRPLTSGRVSVGEALCLFFVLVIAALLLVLSLPQAVRWSVLLWSVPALGCAIAYPFMKRIFATPQLVLGVAFSFAIPMSYAAYGHGWEIWPPVLLLVLANIAWVIAYDTEYAMVDRVDDVKIGVRSSAIFFAQYDLFAIRCLQLLCLILWLAVGYYYALNRYFYWVLLMAALTFVYQFLLIRRREPQSCFMAFLNNNWTGAFVWLAVLVGSVDTA